MHNAITHYRRSDSSPWMALPALTRTGLWRFLSFGTFVALRRADGSVEVRS